MRAGAITFGTPASIINAGGNNPWNPCFNCQRNQAGGNNLGTPGSIINAGAITFGTPASIINAGGNKQQPLEPLGNDKVLYMYIVVLVTQLEPQGMARMVSQKPSTDTVHPQILDPQ